MGLFNRKKEAEKEKTECACGNACECGTNEVKVVEVTSVKILGGGCAKCNQLEANVVEALKELGITCEVEHVKDYAEIAAMGVMSTPAFAINDTVISFGKVVKKDEIVKLIKKIK